VASTDDAALLANVPLFSKLPRDALQELAAHLRHRRYRRGDTVFYQGDPGTSLCIVRDGRIKLGLTSTEGREIILDLFGAGDAFGELALFDGEPRSADAAAVEASELLLLDRDEFMAFVRTRPELALSMMAILGQRLRRDAQLLQDAAFLDVPARLARTILRLADTTAPGQPAVTPRMTQTDLAGMVSTTRETLNKWLSFFQEQGLIRWDKGRITVLRAEQLQQRIR
jgi:CRP/FNR family transcriptional regulator, cyclic AMP receptor protein